LGKKSITTIFLASMIVLSLVLVTATPIGGGLSSALGLNGTNGATARADGQLQMSIRSDLTGDGPYRVGQPIFLQIDDGPPKGMASVTFLYVGGASTSDVQVRTLQRDGLSPPWEPVKGTWAEQGALFRSNSEASLESLNDTTIMINFTRSGNFSLKALPENGSTERMTLGSAAVNVSVIDTAYLFGVPRLGNWSNAEWSNSIAVGEEMNFSIASNTTDLWRRTENWTSFYNWSVAVINTAGMVVGEDIAKYNTGALNLDRGDLERTSVVSAWENGYNSVFYTLWDNTTGVRLTGDAAMTPTGKEITYGGTAWNAWTRGVWEPSGAGYVTFHQAGHYLFVFTLTKDGQVVSPALVQEVVVH
jgi:hypothetical protein